MWTRLCTAIFFFHWTLATQWGPDIDFPRAEKKSEEELLGVLLEDKVEEEACLRRRCERSEQCCKDMVCVEGDGPKLGTCLPLFGRPEGQYCFQESDCAEGLTCMEMTPNGKIPKTCIAEPRDMRKKQYNDECLTTSECDVSKGLCCQLQRRHRMAPRKVCYYFADQLACIGKVDPNLAKPLMVFPNPFFKARIG